jgi:excisionase family DNA binding protein
VTSPHINEPGGIVVVPARLAALLVLRCQLAEYYRHNRGRDPELDELLVALGRAGLAHRGHTSTSDSGTPGDRQPEHGTPSAHGLSTRQAARRLGITDRAVRLAITRRRLPAEAVGGRWVLDLDDVDAYGRRRAG